ncbi:MAG: hypothetical protein O2856_09400 [Planctomycetota bacterium]|nr:hypothetical protein [Planctomycetota bacterium]
MQRRSFLQSSAAISIASVNAGNGGLIARADGVADDPVTRMTQNLNPQIQHAREVALSILKPTAAELERGLRLHAGSGKSGSTQTDQTSGTVYICCRYDERRRHQSRSSRRY